MNTRIDDKTLDELETLLEQLAELQQQLVEAAEAKKRALARLDQEQVGTLAGIEQELVARITQVDMDRRRLLTGLPGQTGAAVPSLAEVGHLAGEPRRSRLAALRDRVVELAQAARRVNAINHFVSRHCLEHFQSLLRVLTAGRRPAPVYTHDGTMRPAGGSCLVDRTA